MAFPFLPAGVAPWSIVAALVMGAGVGIVGRRVPGEPRVAARPDHRPAASEGPGVRLIDRSPVAVRGRGIALEAIRGNKVRAGLTIGGVAIGVFVVVAMAAAVHGITRASSRTSTRSARRASR
jgi:hypothetical protein